MDLCYLSKELCIKLGYYYIFGVNMNTFVIYADKKLNCSQLHINLWATKGTKCIDFGFMVDQGTEAKTLSIILPFQTDISKIEDLNSVMIDHPDVCNGVFHSALTYKGHEPNTLLIDNERENTTFYLPPIINTEVSNFAEKCSEIRIPLPKCNASDEDKQTHNNISTYLRIRIKNPISAAFTDDLIPPDHSFSSAFIAYKIVDFRINDMRTANKEQKVKLQENECIINETHLLYIIDSKDQIIVSNNDGRIRLLEIDLWNKYLYPLKINNEALAYHYTIKNFYIEKSVKLSSFNSFEFMMKKQYSKFSIKTILQYCVIVIGLSVIANLIYKFFPVLWKIQINWKFPIPFQYTIILLITILCLLLFFPVHLRKNINKKKRPIFKRKEVAE